MAEEFDKDTIQRCPHDAENPYAQISRSLIRDDSISPECRWLLIYMLSMRDGWKMKVSQICAHTKKFIGRNRVYELVQEAIEAGYIYREEKMVGNLKCGVAYFISESPKFKKCFRRSDFRETEPRDTENREALSNNNKDSLIESLDIKKKQEREEEGSSPPTPPSPSLFFSLGNVKMEQAKYEKLCADYGKQEVTEKIEEFDEYSRSKPKKFKEYACHAATVRSWLRRDNKQKAQDREPDNVRINKQHVVQVLKQYPHKKRLLDLQPTYVARPGSGKDVSLNLPTETFINAFLSLIGGSYEG